MYADSAFNGSRVQAIIAARDGRALIVQTGTWGGSEALKRLQEYNAAVSARARADTANSALLAAMPSMILG